MTANPYSFRIGLSVVKSNGKTNTRLPIAFREVFLSTPLKPRIWCSPLKATTSRPPHKTSTRINLLWRISSASLSWIQKRHRSNLSKQRTTMVLNWPQITLVPLTWWWTPTTLGQCPAKMTTCFTRATKTNSLCTQASTLSNLCSRTAREDLCHQTQPQVTSALDRVATTVVFPTWPRCSSSISNSTSNRHHSSLEFPCNSGMQVKTETKCSTATMTSTDLSAKVKMMEQGAAATTSTKTLHEGSAHSIIASKKPRISKTWRTSAR